MIPNSLTYQSKLDMARALALLGARAVTITAVARTKPADSRTQYKQAVGYASKSGQTPMDHEWFLTNRSRRMHAALLLIMYEAWRLRFQDSSDAHGLAFITAYRDYLRLIPSTSQPISPERLNLLVSGGFSIGWRDITKGGSSKFASGNVRILNCRKCRIPHLVEAHYINYVCSEC